MKEFIDKLIGRLEEVHNINNKKKKEAYKEKDWETFELFTYRNEGVYSAISIVNQLAEEYKHCTLCYLGSPCEYQNENAVLPDELLKDNNGWIPILERLPSKEEFLKNNGRFIVTDGNRSYQAHFDIYEKKCFGIPRLDGFSKDKCVIAWCELPAPYQPKGE